MIGKIDYELKPQELELWIAKPDRTIISKLAEAYDKNHIRRWADISELKFKIPYEIDIKHKFKRNPNIDQVKDRFLVRAKVGKEEAWYIINRVTDSATDKDYKEVTAMLLPYELKDKMLRGYKNEYINATQVLADALAETLWSVGHIDSKFANTYLSFEVSSKTRLDFVLEIAERFGAIIKWDTDLRTVNFFEEDNVGQDKGLSVAYGKLIKSISRESNADEMTTRLKVFGKDGLSINKINPTGADYIESFAYFLYPFQRDANKIVTAHSDYMSDSLCNAILDYDILVESKKGQFEILLTQKNGFETTLATKQAEITVLQAELSAITDNIDVFNANGSDVSALITQRNAKQVAVNTKQSEIDAVNVSLSGVIAQIVLLKQALSITSNFTSAQIKERNTYIIEKEWVDESYTIPSHLFDEAKRRFEALRSPQVVIKTDVVNFMAVIEEQINWDKLVLGDYISIRYEKLGIDIKARLIEIEVDYEGSNITLTIANVKELMTDKQKLINMLYGAISTSTAVNMDRYKWNNNVDTTGAIEQRINNTWDATKQGITAGIDESVEITRRGLKITDPNDPQKQLIAQHGVLALTNDGGDTWKHAITPDGIVGENIKGKLGEFCKVRADQIIAGDLGEKVPQSLLDVDFSAITTRIDDIQSQVDGSITTWFYNYVPSLVNYPANSWTTDADRNIHLGDLFYDSTTGYAYRFLVNASVYAWSKITDTDITKALSDAQSAKDLADNKRRVFVSTPVPPYDPGDLWSGGSAGDLKRCLTGKVLGQSYNASDWGLASKYTDDTAVVTHNNSATPHGLPSYCSMTSEGIKVFDSASALRVWLGQYAAGKYGLKVVNGEIYGTLFKTGDEAATSYIMLEPSGNLSVVKNGLRKIFIQANSTAGTIGVGSDTMPEAMVINGQYGVGSKNYGAINIPSSGGLAGLHLDGGTSCYMDLDNTEGITIKMPKTGACRIWGDVEIQGNLFVNGNVAANNI